MVTKRHVDAVRSIQSVKALVADKPVHLILTAGFGFRQRPGYKTTTRGEYLYLYDHNIGVVIPCHRVFDLEYTHTHAHTHTHTHTHTHRTLEYN